MFPNDDDMVECPYNETHRMLRKRLQSHLLKCRINYPDVELRKCPFNITHLIPEPEFMYHVTNCSDRKLITQYKYDAPEPKEEEGPKHAPIECEENWDDTDVNDYNPKLYLENAKIIRKPEGANPSERKLFIKKERKRLESCDESNEGDSIENNSETSDIPSPSTSSYINGRSCSPSNKYKRSRSRSPLGFKRSRRERSPPRHRSSGYSSQNLLSRDSTDQTLYSHNSYQDPYKNDDGGTRNSSSYSRCDTFYSYSNNSQSIYDRNTETEATMPRTPPPPIISYPEPRSYLIAKSRSSSDYKDFD